jgi:hypothetical protein
MKKIRKVEVEKGKIKLNMTEWFNGKRVATLDEALHNCGTTACFAGYLALHKPFIKQGVSASACGVPELNDMPIDIGKLMVKLFDMNYDNGRVLCAVTGVGSRPTPYSCAEVIDFLQTELDEQIVRRSSYAANQEVASFSIA